MPSSCREAKQGIRPRMRKGVEGLKILSKVFADISPDDRRFGAAFRSLGSRVGNRGRSDQQRRNFVCWSLEFLDVAMCLTPQSAAGDFPTG